MGAIRVWNFLLNTTFLLYSMCVIGQLMRFSLRAGNAFRSGVNTYPTRRSFWARNFDIFMIRSGLWLVVFFSTWLYHPGWFSWMLIHAFGIAPGIANYLTIPPTLGTAWLAGLVGDGGLDQAQLRIRSRFPNWPRWIAGEVPAYDPVVVKTNELTKDRKPGELPSRKFRKELEE